MKKIVIIVILNLLLIVSIYLLYDSITTHQEMKQEKNNLIKKIKETKISIDIKTKENEEFEIELKSLQEANSPKIEEKNIWKKMQEEIKKGL